MPRKARQKKPGQKFGSGVQGSSPVGSATGPAVLRAPLRESVAAILQNKSALTGFGLSLLQLAGHVSWLLVTVWLQSSGKAATLTAESGWSWFVVGLLGTSLLLTFAALFVCLFYGLRKAPRTLAVAGFLLAFFTGVLATAIVFMSALRSMSANAA